MSGIFIPVDASAGSPTFTAAQSRVAFAALMQTGNNRVLGGMSGIRPGADPTVTPAAPNLTVGVFNGWVDPGTGSTVGPGFFAFTSNTVLTIPAADNTFPRWDRVDVQVPDDPPSGVRTAELIYTAGTPAASPALAAAPARSMFVGWVVVPQAGGGSATWNIGQQYAVAAGGIQPCPGSASYPATPYKGMVVADTVLLRLVYYSGSAWVPVGNGRMASTTFSTDLASSTTTEVVGYSQAVPLINGRKYRVWFNGMFNGGAAGNVAFVRIRFSTSALTNASTLAGQAQKLYHAASGSGGRFSYTFFAEFTAPSTATYNIGVGVATASGTGNETIVGATDTPTVVTVDDVT